jgi:putative intracellular protease/amidase
MWKFLAWAGATLVVLAAALAVAGWAAVRSMDLDAEPRGNPLATAADLAFVRDGVQVRRGRILAVLSSTAHFDQGRRRGGYELTELARAWWVFVANGYEVDLASPLGGEPPQVLDEGLTDADYAFLNDPAAQSRLVDTIALAQVDPSRYAAVYFVGGKGAMFDFPGNPDIARIVREIAPRGVIGAVCHGPAALLDLTLADGRPLLEGRRVTGFSNDEELFLIDDARTVFPFLLQDALAAGARQFVAGPMYLDNTVVDGRLVTGQNPWSTWSVAEAMVRALGHEPVPRLATSEEVAVRLLGTYHAEGIDAALDRKARSAHASKQLLLMHAVVAAMQMDLRQAWQLQRLARK